MVAETLFSTMFLSVASHETDIMEANLFLEQNCSGLVTACVSKETCQDFFLYFPTTLLTSLKLIVWDL